MKKASFNTKKITGALVAAFFIVTGTYNAVVINSDSHINTDVKFVKRLDEIYGVVKPGREVAASITWQKLSREEVKEIKKYAPAPVSKSLVAVTTTNTEVVNELPQAAVQEELDLNLVEVVNPKKYAQGLGTDKFSGNLVTNQGVIESLNVSLPNGEGVSVSFSEMSGNVFEYDLNGDLYSGMMYQVDQNSYMVTLTNGPLEGTRMKFNATAQEENLQESRDYLAENHNVEVGNFGEEAPQAQEVQPEMMVDNAQNPDAQFQAQGFNFESQQQAM